MIFQLKIEYSLGEFTGIAWSILTEHDLTRQIYLLDAPASYGRSMAIDTFNDVY
jgi:hypothetical protein